VIEREQVAGPPKGFRPAIPWRVKLEVVLKQEGKCFRCGEKLAELANTQFDHVPALQSRIWCEELNDTVPPANSIENIEALHKDCHSAKTTGRKGTSRLSLIGGDAQEIAKTRRLERKRTEEFRQKLLARDTPEPEAPSKPKSKWPSRPFPKRAKDDPRSQKGTKRVKGAGRRTGD
jgi:hypothetical protein